MLIYDSNKVNLQNISELFDKTGYDDLYKTGGISDVIFSEYKLGQIIPHIKKMIDITVDAKNFNEIEVIRILKNPYIIYNLKDTTLEKCFKYDLILKEIKKYYFGDKELPKMFYFPLHIKIHNILNPTNKIKRNYEEDLTDQNLNIYNLKKFLNKKLASLDKDIIFKSVINECESGFFIIKNTFSKIFPKTKSKLKNLLIKLRGNILFSKNYLDPIIKPELYLELNINFNLLSMIKQEIKKNYSDCICCTYWFPLKYEKIKKIVILLVLKEYNLIELKNQKGGVFYGL